MRSSGKNRVTSTFSSKEQAREHAHFCGMICTPATRFPGSVASALPSPHKNVHLTVDELSLRNQSDIKCASMEELHELLPVSLGMQRAHRVCESASITLLAATSEEVLACTHGPSWHCFCQLSAASVRVNLRIEEER